MPELHEELEVLRQLNDLRIRAKDLREQSLFALKHIGKIHQDWEKVGDKWKKRWKKIDDKERIKPKKNSYISFKNWFSSGNDVEIALLVKVQNHRDISEDEEENNNAEASDELKKRLKGELSVLDFFQTREGRKLKRNDADPKRLRDDSDDEPTVPVLMAARVMQALVSRSETVFSETTMYCYYRILRELYIAGSPDWTFGAARAGKDGSTSAFVTGECIRAILSLENSIQSTITFLKNLGILYKKYLHLREMIKSLGDEEETKIHPLRKWADLVIDQLWLDSYLTTNPRGRQIALYYGAGDGAPNLLPQDEKREITMDVVGEYFEKIIPQLQAAAKKNSDSIIKAIAEIDDYRIQQETPESIKRQYRSRISPKTVSELTEYYSKQLSQPRNIEEEADENFYIRTASAHSSASRVITNAGYEAVETIKVFDEEKDLNKIIGKLIIQGEKLTRNMRKILEPIKQYIKTVIRRELAASPSMFDPGELVFAATAFGVMTEWKQNELLTRACKLLVEALPESGRLPIKRAFHSNQRGYRMLPIGCEMTRCLAQLFQKINYEVEPKLVGRMLNIFEEKMILLDEKYKKKALIAWNFDGAPNPKKPCVWVSSVAVLALDRIIRMLNSRINNMVLRHFEVIKPDRPHLDLTLNDLVYTDYGFNAYKKDSKQYENQPSIPICLEQMRAHVMRAKLPGLEKYKQPVFSTIFYGPPGTGKTTLAEALALSSRVPVVSISPSDLMVQGQALIEGRARDVFEALSMLTQAVIILDEFEPVLKRRGGDENGQNKGEKKGNDEAGREQEKWLEQIAGELKEIGKKDDPTFKFLLAGMLPKLLKLHDAAKRQSLVYCLATNYLKEIDEAAKRRGRFDTMMPVYNPCPLSRAGTFLFRLSQIKKVKRDKLDLGANARQRQRFIEVIRATGNEPASELSGNYYKIKEEENEIKGKSDYFSYVLTGNPKVDLTAYKTEKLEELVKDKSKLEDFEIEERNWLINFEAHLKNEHKTVVSDDLKELLGFKPGKN
jgi:hypothetical protein